MDVFQIEELYDSGMTIGLIARHIGVPKLELEEFMEINGIFKMDRRQRVAIIKKKEITYETVFLKVGDIRNTLIQVRKTFTNETSEESQARYENILARYRKKLIKKKK